MTSSKWLPNSKMDITKYLKPCASIDLQVEHLPECHSINTLTDFSRINRVIGKPPVVLNAEMSTNKDNASGLVNTEGDSIIKNSAGLNETSSEKVKPGCGDMTEMNTMQSKETLGASKSDASANEVEDKDKGLSKNDVVLDDGFARMMDSIGNLPKQDHLAELEITGFRTVYHPTDDNVEIVKEEEHIGMELERLFASINDVLTVSEIDTIDEELFATTAYDSLVMVLELVERLEVCMVSGWKNPRRQQEDMVFAALDGLLMNLNMEVDRELDGWRFATFQQFGGPTLMRDITTRFKLVEQSRDMIRKLSSVSRSPDTDGETKLKVLNFIEETSREALIGFGLNTWFEKAVELMTGLDITVDREEFPGLFGVDMEAMHGSIPNLEVLREEETSADEGEEVLVFGSGIDGMRGLDQSEIEEVPNLTAGTVSDSGSEDYELDNTRSVKYTEVGAILVTKKFETTGDMNQTDVGLDLSYESSDGFEFINLSELANSLPEETSSILDLTGEKPSAKYSRNQRGENSIEVETSSPKEGEVEEYFDFKNLDSSAVEAPSTGAPSGIRIVDWAREACNTLEDLINESPAKPGEVDGVEIVGYQDGVRVVSRLKKKIEKEVEEYCTEQEYYDQDGACASKVSGAEMGPNGSKGERGFPSI